MVCQPNKNQKENHKKQGTYEKVPVFVRGIKMQIDKNGKKVREGDTITIRNTGIDYQVVTKNNQLGVYEDGEFIALSEALRVFVIKESSGQNHQTKRHKEQGIYRLNKALRDLNCLEESIKEIEDDMDKDNAVLELDEIRWCVREGLKDLLEGK